MHTIEKFYNFVSFDKCILKFNTELYDIYVIELKLKLTNSIIFRSAWGQSICVCTIFRTEMLIVFGTVKISPIKYVSYDTVRAMWWGFGYFDCLTLSMDFRQLVLVLSKKRKNKWIQISLFLEHWPGRSGDLWNESNGRRLTYATWTYVLFFFIRSFQVGQCAAFIRAKPSQGYLAMLFKVK